MIVIIMVFIIIINKFTIISKMRVYINAVLGW